MLRAPYSTGFGSSFLLFVCFSRSALSGLLFTFALFSLAWVVVHKSEWGLMMTDRIPGRGKVG